MRSKFALFLLLLLVAVAETSFSQTGGAAGGASGGGGGAGGSLFGFKYILYPRYEQVKDKPLAKAWAGFRHWYHELFLGSRNLPLTEQRQTVTSALRLTKLYGDTLVLHLLTGRIENYQDSLVSTDSAKRGPAFRTRLVEDSIIIHRLAQSLPKNKKYYINAYGVDELYYYPAPDSSKVVTVIDSSSYQLLPRLGTNRRDTIRFYSAKKVVPPQTDSVSLTDFLDKEAQDKNTYHRKLKIYVSAISKNTDSMTFKIWHYNNIKKHKASPFGMNADTAYQTDFSFVIPWNDTMGIHRKFILPFRTKYLTAINIPFLYDHNTDSFAVSFLNAGIAYGFAFGRTKFYEYNQMTPRNSYFGFGPMVNLSSTLTASNSSTFAKLVMGGHIGYTTGSVQFLGILGWYGNFVPKHGLQMQCKPIYGFGVGLSLFNFSVPTASSPATGH